MTEHVGRPQGGMKSEAGRAAYWRMQHEAATGALADLIVEHRELVERIEALADQYAASAADEPYGGELWSSTEDSLRALLTDPTMEGRQPAAPLRRSILPALAQAIVSPLPPAEQEGRSDG